MHKSNSFFLLLIAIFTFTQFLIAEEEPDISNIEQIEVLQHEVFQGAFNIYQPKQLAINDDKIIIAGDEWNSNPDNIFMKVDCFDLDFNEIWTRSVGYYNNDLDIEFPHADNMVIEDGLIKIWGVNQNNSLNVFFGQTFYFKSDLVGNFEFKMDTLQQLYALEGKRSSSLSFGNDNIYGITYHNRPDGLELTFEKDKFFVHEINEIPLDTFVDQGYTLNTKVIKYDESSFICVANFDPLIPLKKFGYIIYFMDTTGNVINKHFVKTDLPVHIIDVFKVDEEEYFFIANQSNTSGEVRYDWCTLFFFNTNDGVYKEVRLDSSETPITMWSADYKDGKIVLGGEILKYKGEHDEYFDFFLQEYDLTGNLLAKQRWGGDYDDSIWKVKYLDDSSILLVGRFSTDDYYKERDFDVYGTYLAKVRTKTTSVNDSDIEINEISISPNPADNTIRINSSMIGRIDQIVIYDAVGNEILSSNSFNPNEEIDISNFSSGMYLVRLSSGNAHYYSKFIKQ